MLDVKDDDAPDNNDDGNEEASSFSQNSGTGNTMVVAYSPPETEEEDDDEVSNVARSRKTDVSVLSEGRSCQGSSIKSKLKRRKKNQVVDDDALAMLTAATDQSFVKNKEMVRHNKFLEMVEERRLSLEQRREDRLQFMMHLEQEKLKQGEWKEKTDKLAYKVKLLHEFKQLVSTGMGTREIVTLFPEMAEVSHAVLPQQSQEMATNTKVSSPSRKKETSTNTTSKNAQRKPAQGKPKRGDDESSYESSTEHSNYSAEE
jgi:hypothetical protein